MTAIHVGNNVDVKLDEETIKIINCLGDNICKIITTAATERSSNEVILRSIQALEKFIPQSDVGHVTVSNCSFVENNKED